MKQAEIANEAYRKANAMNITADDAVLTLDPSDLSMGKAIFKEKCTDCHGDKGEGDIGPNLTDRAWIYGYDISDVFYSIQKGRPGGMKAHEAELNPIQIQNLASYVIQFPEAEGLDPQGDIIEEEKTEEEEEEEEEEEAK
jgi:cytochrome c oxidase cbb3-type subunit 3